jgi:3-oxoacyl-[acyl-carrier protein] reductase
MTDHTRSSQSLEHSTQSLIGTGFDFSNKVVVITGASRGIGRAIAQAFALAKARVALTYQACDTAAHEALKSLYGEGHKLFKFDASEPETSEKSLIDISQQMGGLHVLINNAGITRDQLLLRLKPSDWDAVVQTNLRSVYGCTKAAVKIMLKNREGSIVNITSVIGQTGNAGQSNYAASKAGIIAFTKSVAKEVASRQIRLNCVAPGFIRSDMTETLSEAQKASIMAQVPLGSVGEPSDVAACCLFLASPLARYITGHTLNVNGGLYME